MLGGVLTIQDLGNIGEFVAAIATVVTLVYLAVQIRQNTRSLTAAAHQDATRSANDWGALFIHHPETAALFRKGIADPTALDPEESIEFDHIASSLLRNYSLAKQLTEDGLIVSTSICATYERTIRRWFESPAEPFNF